MASGEVLRRIRDSQRAEQFVKELLEGTSINLFGTSLEEIRLNVPPEVVYAIRFAPFRLTFDQGRKIVDFDEAGVRTRTIETRISGVKYICTEFGDHKGEGYLKRQTRLFAANLIRQYSTHPSVTGWDLGNYGTMIEANVIFRSSRPRNARPIGAPCRVVHLRTV